MEEEAFNRKGYKVECTDKAQKYQIEKEQRLHLITQATSKA